MNTRPLAFLDAASRETLPGRPALIGLPFDGTCTYRMGAADAPRAIREVSDSIETYSPLLDMDLEDSPFADLGDLEFTERAHADVESILRTIELAATDIESRGAKILAVGGEHTITLPIVRVLAKTRPDLLVVHLDAHTDLRDHYEGNRFSHATVMRRVYDVLGPGRLVQLGIRAGTREEFRWMRDQNTILNWGENGAEDLRARIGSRPVYLTLDLDVLDPACLPGTGNPEPGGWFYKDLERLLVTLGSADLIGADVVELNPGLDPSQASSVTAAKIVRELLLIL
ncbi:MAG: agmatinase [Thermodesulfobacteriota bacterium]